MTMYDKLEMKIAYKQMLIDIDNKYVELSRTDYKLSDIQDLIIARDKVLAVLATF